MTRFATDDITFFDLAYETHRDKLALADIIRNLIAEIDAHHRECRMPCNDLAIAAIDAESRLTSIMSGEPEPSDDGDECLDNIVGY